MGISAENIEGISRYAIGDHAAVLDMYVTVGRDIESISLRFGISPMDVALILEAYGEHVIPKEGEASPKKKKGLFSRGGGGINDMFVMPGRGRHKDLPRHIVDDFVDFFYPGIVSDNLKVDSMNIDRYLSMLNSGTEEDDYGKD